ncbi:serine hydrolase domain-containing protein [Streptomyces sp. NRRL S-495]|uniref:serine hydrolase domain-containing protein n=1 Tax=Streptomyces sp. NRRL S-495 TaxID=1609133 RepID=UPI000698C6AB|nr:serine hydrolase domain-containing protein [Streptomyces sp. NRRL S-495]
MKKHALPATLTLALVVGATLPTAAASATSAHPRCGNHQALQGALDGLTGEHRLAGAVVEVVDPACGTWAGASGVAEVRTGRPASAGDRLRIGSVTKTFTATVVLQLAAEGRLSLDSTVADHLPGLVQGGGYDGRAITVRQLLQQTGGLPDHADAFADADVDWLRHHRFEPRELVEAALRLPHPAPGWHYSTTNYVLAGLVVEQVTGRSIEDEATRRVIDPLRLRDTYWPGMAEDIRGRHSHSYFTAERDGGPVRVDGTRWNTSAGGAGGALISTPSDVNRFLAALLGGRLLPAAQLAEMRTTVPGDPERLGSEGRYGLGLITEPLSCGGVWTGHTGSTRAGHHTVTATAPGGRQATIAINESPTTDAAANAVLAALYTALCPPRT